MHPSRENTGKTKKTYIKCAGSTAEIRLHARPISKILDELRDVI